MTIEKGECAPRYGNPISRVGILAIVIQAFQAHPFRQLAVLFFPKPFVLEHIAPLISGIWILLINANLDIAILAYPLVTKIIR